MSADIHQSPLERARRAYSRVLQAMQEPGKATAIAAVMGVSDSTISRLKTERMEDVLTLIYALGFKIVGSDKTCVDASMLDFMRQTTARALSGPCPNIWEDQE